MSEREARRGGGAAGMPIGIGRSAAAGAPPDAADMLLECHRRIRHFSSVGRAVLAEEAPAAEVAAAAEGVRTYFQVALPLHSTDEDASIAPRLLALPLPAPIREAISRMSAQHDELHRLLGLAIPGWAAIADDPGRRGSLRAELGRLVDQLDALWGAHLGAEEAIIFPALRALIPSEEQARIVAEMRARRAT